MKSEYIISWLIVGFIGVGLATLFIFSPGNPNKQLMKESVEPYKEIVNPSGFVNTDAITIKELIGKKIVLVDFLTYSCINCQRTFPYLNTWYEKYKDQGLEIVGIHTPEFAFEKNIENVREAMKKFGINHPIVLDNDYATWRAYGNRYWPRKYLIDINGNIVYDHIGEGAYDVTEMKIRELLAERAEVLGEAVKINNQSLAAETIPKIVIASQSPETYFGSDRNQYLANGIGGLKGERVYSLPETFVRNSLYLGGVWNIFPEYAESAGDTSVVYKYNAKEVYIVADADIPTEVEIIQDGKSVSTAGGADADNKGIVTIKESRLYKLIRNPEPGEHILRLKINGRGVRLYAFTFG